MAIHRHKSCKITDRNPITPVLFRVFKDEGDVIALFPTVVGDANYTSCMSYQHLGQHGAADLRGVLHRTRPAKPSEYAALKRELERVGYKLRVVMKVSSTMDRARHEDFNKYLRGRNVVIR